MRRAEREGSPGNAIHDLELDHSPARALRAVQQAADLWGGHWQPDGHAGRLALPVVRGLRRGVVEGRLSAEPRTGGCTLRLEVVRSEYRLNRPAVTILALGAVGGLTTVFWPFFPHLLRIAPAGAVLALVAWLLVSSRLRSSEEGHFLELVAELAASA